MMTMPETRVELDRADYFELKALMFQRALALKALEDATNAMTAKMNALAEAKQFYKDANWGFDDATCSLVARG